MMPRSQMPGRVAQSVARLTQELEVPGSILGPATYFPFLAISYWRRYVHEALVNRLEGLILPRKSLIMIT